jgi:hypothetical protein
MGALSESKSEILVYKLYASAVIDSTTEPVRAVDPAVGSAQIFRHIDHNFNKVTDQYQPNEKRSDGQAPMGKSGTGVVNGTINGFMSPGTHADHFRGAFRSDWTAAVTATEADFTSVAMSASGSTITYGGGDPVAKGYRVGMIIAHTNITGLNLGKQFLILGFSGSNRVLQVYPAPLADLTADTAFNVTSVGKTIGNPLLQSSMTDYKFAYEWYGRTADSSRFASECRVGGFDVSAPVNGNVGLNFSVMGRNRVPLSGASSPFFTSPTSPTTTDIPSSMQGLIRLAGSTIALSTTSATKVDLKPQAAKAKNAAGLVAGILLDDFMATGSFTSFLDGNTLFDAYDNQTEMEYLEFYPTSSADAPPSQVIYMPRIRLTKCDEITVDGAKAAQCEFQAAHYLGSTAGVPSVTMQITDTHAV